MLVKWKRQFGNEDATMPDLLPGYRIKIIDGNASAEGDRSASSRLARVLRTIAASEHRLKELRQISSAPLPGQSLVVLDPSLMLAVDVFLCVDGEGVAVLALCVDCELPNPKGHAQERSLFDEVLPTVEEDYPIYQPALPSRYVLGADAHFGVLDAN